MPKKISETDNIQITLTKSLIDQLEALALTGMFGSSVQAVIEHILSQKLMKLRASGEFASLRTPKIYPARGGDDGSKKDE
jgi:uncharacterized membrane protein YqgA involved in biofilm formation